MEVKKYDRLSRRGRMYGVVDVKGPAVTIKEIDYSFQSAQQRRRGRKKVIHISEIGTKYRKLKLPEVVVTIGANEYRWTGGDEDDMH